MQIIGESINSNIPATGKAIQSRDASFLAQLAREQRDAGADMLDICAAAAGVNEIEVLPWLVQLVQAEVDTPLVLDSLNAQALEAALAVCQRRVIINSLSDEERRWQELLPLVVGYRCGAIVMCMGSAGIPDTAQGRLSLAQKLVARALRAGIAPQDLYLDPLVMSLGANWQAGKVTLETLRLIHQKLPEVHTICAISNVSFGLPRRRLLNASFLAMAIAMGVDTLLVNVCDKTVMATLWAANVAAGNDKSCLTYLKGYRAGRLG